MSDPYLIDPARLAAIKATQLLDTPPEECFDQYSREAKRILKAEMAIVSLVMVDRHFYKCALGLECPLKNRRKSPIAFSLCKIGVERREPLVIRDGLNDPESKDHPAITQLKIQSYLSVPLMDENDHALGTLCVANLVPQDWTDQDITSLSVLAQTVQNEIRLRKLEPQQKASQEARDLLSGILETSIAAITVLNPDGRILYCNQGAERVLGPKSRADLTTIPSGTARRSTVARLCRKISHLIRFSPPGNPFMMCATPSRGRMDHDG